MPDKDTIYQQPLDDVAAFEFNAAVTDVFDDMLERSVPGYSLLLRGIGVAAAKFISPDSTVYDLGASLGNTSAAILGAVSDLPYRLVAVDNSEPMCRKCRSALVGQESTATVEVICEDIASLQFEPSSLIVMNLTLQFVAAEQRESIIQRIYDALIPGGAFVLSEKVAPEAGSDLFIQLHEQFKKQSGYSNLEIAQKRTALERVLVPEPVQTHVMRLKSAGFTSVQEWFRCFNFSSIIAVK